MNATSTATSTAPAPSAEYARFARHYSTDEAAAVLKVRPQTLRAALCRDGAYCGVMPAKRRNRFLAWPADPIDALAAGEVA
jgi:hypothetical protein